LINSNAGRLPEENYMDIGSTARAIEILKTRKAKALQDLTTLMTNEDGRIFFDGEKQARQIVAMCDAAGVDAGYLEKYLKPPQKPFQRVNLYASQGFDEPGADGTNNQTIIYAEAVCRGQIDISRMTAVRSEGQSKEDFDQLVKVIADYREGTAGDCAQGLKLLTDAGVGGGFISRLMGGSQDLRNITQRKKLWQIRLAVAEARVILKRAPSVDLAEMVMTRLGLANLLPAVVTGEIRPQDRPNRNALA
jgi:hypothetical protein